MLNRLRYLPVLFACALIAGCGGRVARPVAAANDYDDRLSCEHLTAERAVNDATLADLVSERKHDDTNNVGMLLVGPLFLDLSSAERTEALALAKRNQTLDSLIQQKCGANRNQTAE